MSAIFLALAKGLLSALASKIFSSIFSSQSPQQYFTELLKEIKKIIHIENVSNDITLIQGKVDGVISQMTIDYVNKKNSGASKKDLINFLAPIEATINDDIMGPLEALTNMTESKGNAQQSLLVYVVGAGMQFAVLQEMAKEDPSQSTPSKSQYAADIKAYAKKYSTHATTLLANIKKSRFDDITPVMCMGSPVGAYAQNEQQRDPDEILNTMAWPSGTRNYTFAVEDKWLGTTPVSNTSVGSIWYPCSKQLSGYAKSVKDRASYVASTETTFTKDWAPIQKNIDAWTTLETNPIP